MARRHNKFKVYPWLLFQIHKKRRIIGRVQCKNIKTQCPKVTCTDPILLPGRCCKVCPGSEDQSKPYICSVTRFLSNEMRKTVPILLNGFSYKDQIGPERKKVVLKLFACGGLFFVVEALKNTKNC